MKNRTRTGWLSRQKKRIAIRQLLIVGENLFSTENDSAKDYETIFAPSVSKNSSKLIFNADENELYEALSEKFLPRNKEKSAPGFKGHWTGHNMIY